jgi:hypothetical protein
VFGDERLNIEARNSYRVDTHFGGSQARRNDFLVQPKFSMVEGMKHVVLLGDSIFDNSAYVNGGPDVIAHLGSILPRDWKASLLAVDGSITSDVIAQLERIPKSATHLIVSAGGNDGLARADILQKPTVSVGAAVDELALIRAEFQQKYIRMLHALQKCGKPFAICTVYDPHFPEELMQRLTTTALNVFNDCILREAIVRGLPVLDLRLVCSEPGDYANAIEPGVAGGRKIAAGILDLVERHDFSGSETVVYKGSTRS